MANPFLESYISGQEQSRRQGLAAMQQRAQEVQIGGALQKMQLAEQQRQDFANATTDEEKAAVAMKWGGPQAVMSHLDRVQKAKDTKEMALSRLAQVASQAEQTHQYRMSTLTKAADRAAEQQRHNSFLESVQRERLKYDTGANIAMPARPMAQPEAQPAITPAAPTATAPAPVSAAPAAAEVPGVVPSTFATLSQAQSGGLEGRFPPKGVEPTPATGNNVLDKPVMPPEPVMPAIIANAPKRIQDKWRADQTKPSIAGAGQFTPQALQFTAQQYLSGDRQAIQGFARSATARIALQNAIVDEAQRQNMSPQATAAKIAEFQGTLAGARTVGQRAANISLAATEAQEMIGIVKETSDKFKRTSFVPWNMALKAYESGTGSPEIAEFGASINALVNVYARAINPTGQPTVSDKEHARAIINSVQSPAQVDAVLGIINRELEIAKKAPSTVRAATTQSITGTAAAPSAPKVVDFGSLK